MGELKCLNPWDPQSKRQYEIDGVYCALNAGNASGGQAHGICYAIEGNTVDRSSGKNGRGWCEDVSPTLNTQDRHAICFQLCGDRDNPSVSTSDKAYCLPANPMSDRCQAVVYDGSSVTSPKNWNNPKPGDPCYSLHTDSRNYLVISLEGNGARPSHMGKGFSNDGTMYTLNTIEQHSVCYSISGKQQSLATTKDIASTLGANDYKEPQSVCYAVDCRNLCTNEEVSGTLQAKDNGGFSYNYLNPVLLEKNCETEKHDEE